MTTVLKPIASLKLTVVLFALSFFLVLAGTLAQIDKGIWTVVDEYFRCYFTWIELFLFFPRDWKNLGFPLGWLIEHVRIPFPGGWAIGAALLINILTAHAVRFRMAAAGTRLAVGLLFLAAGGILTWLVYAGMFNQDVAATEGAAFWRVLWRLIQGGGAAVVLLVACVLLFKKRAGIVLLHGGIILLLLAEVITGSSAVEGQMRINQGEKVNFVVNNRSVELALTDHSDSEFDRFTVVPKSRLLRGGPIQDENLPFDIEVVQYMKNSKLVGVNASNAAHKNPATAGTGLRALAIEQPETSGVDSEQRIDVPAAYVRLTKKGSSESLGTYVVTPWLPVPELPQQTVTVGGKTYDLSLRFKRTYKPYSVELIEFRHDKYIGTEKAKNFSALVRLVDENRNVDRTVKIWMNNPLRYAGETFYQSSFEPGRNLTILQVVRNDGWMLPYLSCMIVGAGLTVHFWITLVGFLRRRVSL